MIADGSPNVRLTGTGGGVVSFLDENQQHRVILGFADDTGGLVSLLDENQQHRVVLSSRPDGEGMVTVNGKDGKIGVRLMFTDTGGAMQILNKGGQTVIDTSVANTGAGAIVMKDKLGYQTISLPSGMVSVPND